MNQSFPSVRVAIAAARLDHVTRGVETWARDIFDALVQRGVDVTLYKGSGRCRSARERVLPSIRKGSRLSDSLLRLAPRFCWRFGLGSGDALEETTFAIRLIREIRRSSFDIVHIQDAQVAVILQFAASRGWIKVRVILGHGTEEPSAKLARFPYLQHLAPYHLKEALESLCLDAAARPCWYAIPNFVNTEVFRPPHDDSERKAARARFGIPADAFVVLSVAAIKKAHKRIDYLIRDVASIPDHRVFLVVAGARDAETDALISTANDLMGGRAIMCCDLGRDQIVEIFRASDVFALCSLKEMMPIALLEALASGLPALVNTYPVLQWMTGSGGLSMDMRCQCVLAEAVAGLMQDPVRRAELGMNARNHAVRMFSRDAVLDRVVQMYKEVLRA